MPLPDGVRLHAEQLIYWFCQTAVPPGMQPCYRLEFRTRGSSITLYESRPSWVPSIGRWLRIPMVLVYMGSGPTLTRPGRAS